MAKASGAGSLFPKDAHGRFIELSGSRYDAMMARLLRKGLIVKDHPPFTKEQFRAHLLAAMNGKEDGFVRCRYCLSFFGIEDISIDHEIPLSRRGSTGLDNIGYPCSRCNKQKGGMDPTEFLNFLDYLERELPYARQDILDRLEKAVGFAQAASQNAAVIGELKKSGYWQQAQKERRERKKAKESGLGRF